MKGNPGYEAAQTQLSRVLDRDLSANQAMAELATGQLTATLALAHEARIANLLATAELERQLVHTELAVHYLYQASKMMGEGA